MWVVFCDPQTVFYQVDKYVVDLVEDKDISSYQDMLFATMGGSYIEFHEDVSYLQHFFRTELGVDYSVKKIDSWVKTPERDKKLQEERLALQMQRALKSRVAVLLNPCNNAR